jgi:hypothetical protein
MTGLLYNLFFIKEEKGDGRFIDVTVNHVIDYLVSTPNTPFS